MPEIKNISLTVKGTDCSACAEKIEKALMREELPAPACCPVTKKGAYPVNKRR